MRSLVSIAIFIAISMVVVVIIGRKFKISNRYERKPRELSAWNSLDRGIDPTKAKKK